MKYLLHILIFSILTMSLVPVAGAVPPRLNDSGTANGVKDVQVGSPAGQKDSNTGTAVGDKNALTLKNPIQAKSIGALFQAIIDIVLVFAIPVVVFFIILAGFRYVTARGNGHTIEEAHMALLYALIGGVLILGARVLIEVISGTVDAIKG